MNQLNQQAISSNSCPSEDRSTDISPAELCEELKRCSHLEHLLLEELEEMLSEGVADDDTRWIEQTLDRLCASIDREFALMESNGYLSEVLEERPSWDHIVSELRETHDELRGDLREIRELLSAPKTRRRVTRRHREQFEAWMQKFLQHKRRETDLIQDALATDLGEGE